MSHPLLERHIERQAVKPLYLFYGDEEFLMNRALPRLEAALTDRAGEPPSKVVREAQEVELPGVFGRVPGRPPCGDRGSSSSCAGWTPTPRPSSRPSPAIWTTRRPGPGWCSWPKVSRPGRWKNTRCGGGWPREEAALGFHRLREGELYQWLTREARLLGKNLTLAAAQRLVEMVGNNLAELSQELEKLALFAGPENTLTPALVTQLASHSRTYNIFALVEALGAPGFHQRLTSLGQLLDLGEHPAKILGMLARQVRMLIRVKEGAGANPVELARSLGVPQWQGQEPGAAGGSLQRRGPQGPPGHAAPGGLQPQDQHRQPPALAGVGLDQDGAGVR